MNVATLPISIDPALLRLLDKATDRATSTRGTVYLTHVEPLPRVPDPLAFLQNSASALGDGLFWSQPHCHQTFAGAGSTAEISIDGPERFHDVATTIRSLSELVMGHDDEIPLPLIGGFAFADSPARSARWSGFTGGRLVLPGVLVQISGDQAHLRVTEPVSPHDSMRDLAGRLSDLLWRCRTWAAMPAPSPHIPQLIGCVAIPDRRTWEASVASVVDLIRHGQLDKVVLAREERHLADEPISPFATLARLRERDCEATLFAMQAGSSWFLGATPERLVRLHDGQVDVSCLAGSIAIGETPDEQRRLAAELLASGKNREEHEIVVRTTLAALQDVCGGPIDLPVSPRIVTARSVQHLETPLSCRLGVARNVIELVERLHPTPAVGGHPRDRAISALAELEDIDRGWYAGPFGWASLDGSGEFAVAIRSALLSGHTASIFAGSGIVADSIPAEEFEETRLKLQPMLSALGGP